MAGHLSATYGRQTAPVGFAPDERTQSAVLKLHHPARNIDMGESDHHPE